MNDTLILFALRYVNEEDLTDEQVEVFLSLLHQSGLLVRRGRMLTVPNEDIQAHFTNNIVQKYYRHKYHIDPDKVNKCTDEFRKVIFGNSNDTTKLKRAIQQVLNSMTNDRQEGNEHRVYVAVELSLLQLKRWTLFLGDKCLSKPKNAKRTGKASGSRKTRSKQKRSGGQKRKGPGKRPDILIYCKFLHFIIVVELKFGAKENSTNAMRQMSKNKYSHKWYTDRRDCKPNEVIEIDKAIAIAIHAKIKCDEEQSEDEEEEDTDSNSENNSTDANEDELDQWDGDECIDWEAEIQIKSADRGKNEKIEDFLKRFELSLIN